MSTLPEEPGARGESQSPLDDFFGALAVHSFLGRAPRSFTSRRVHSIVRAVGGNREPLQEKRAQSSLGSSYHSTPWILSRAGRVHHALRNLFQPSGVVARSKPPRPSRCAFFLARPVLCFRQNDNRDLQGLNARLLAAMVLASASSFSSLRLPLIRTARIGAAFPIEVIVTVFCAVTLVYFQLIKVCMACLSWWKAGGEQRGRRRDEGLAIVAWLEALGWSGSALSQGGEEAPPGPACLAGLLPLTPGYAACPERLQLAASFFSGRLERRVQLCRLGVLSGVHGCRWSALSVQESRATVRWCRRAGQSRGGRT